MEVFTSASRSIVDLRPQLLKASHCFSSDNKIVVFTVHLRHAMRARPLVLGDGKIRGPGNEAAVETPEV